MKRTVLLAFAITSLAGPALAQDKPVWNLFVDPTEIASLSWTIPDSDDSGPSLSCEPGSGVVRATMFVEKRIATSEPDKDGNWRDPAGRLPPWLGELGLRSRLESASLTADVFPEEMNGGSMVVARLPADAPVLAAFARTGEIRLSAFGETQSPPKAPVDKVAKLLEACAKRWT